MDGFKMILILPPGAAAAAAKTGTGSGGAVDSFTAAAGVVFLAAHQGAGL